MKKYSKIDYTNVELPEELLTSFAKALNVPPEKILYVGNSIRADINGAKKAGMKTAYIMPFWRKILNKKLAQADISFKNYRQLKKIVLE